MQIKSMGIKIDDALLEKYAENEARALRVTGRVHTARLARYIEKNLRVIQSTALRLSGWVAGRTGLPQEFEWLLDNRYLFEREAREAVLVLRRAGKLPAAEKTRRPAAYELAAGLARTGQNAVTAERLGLYLSGAQKTRPFSERELWLFVPLVKAALIASVAGLCEELLSVLAGYKKQDENNPYCAELTVRRALEEGSAPPEVLEELAHVAAAAHTRLSGWIGQAVSSLRLLTSIDLTELLQKASLVETLLRQDPAEVYPVMDEASRAFYRQELSRLARRRGLSEQEAAEAALSLSRRAQGSRQRHVGYYILNQPMGKRKSRWPGILYFSLFALLTALVATAAGCYGGGVWAAALLLLPASELAKNAADFAAVRLMRPRHIPRLELADGIPARGATLCVISALLTDSGHAEKYAKLLEEYKIANRDAGGWLMFGLLADLPDAANKRRTGDRHVIEAAQKIIFELNRRHGGGFYLFLRDRQLNVRDGVYMGWERKRGALLELMRALRGKPTGLRTVTGDPAPLKNIRYLITLDADTRLTAGSAREMAGAMLHPLSAPDIDPDRRVVVEGHAVLQPRVAIDLVSAGSTAFSRVYAGQGGLDPYGGASSDVYQDLFDRGVFTGKGIFDVDAYLDCLDGRFRENRILSHDLLEGCFLRAGLLGDVELADGYPARVSAWFDRLHRWTRGDWQIAGFLGRRLRNGEGQREPNPLDGLSKWKIFDNLRRSLSPVCLLLALTLGLASPTGPLLFISGLALLCAASNLLLSAAELAVRGSRHARYHSTIVTGFAATVSQCGIQLLLLPYQAFVCLHATCAALWRMLVSHKRLLRWVTAAEAERFSGGVRQYARRMFAAVIWGVLCAFLSPAGWLAGIIWVLSPLLAYRLSLPRRAVRQMPGEDRVFLMRQAALIWQYFEDFLTPEDHFLPPDNWQEQPAAGVAHRTSPTNIGLGLLCVLAAHDMQLVGEERALRLIDRMLTTLEQLPKWHGHIFNWYDTRTLETLRPRYISTVDSGNLACCLIALREGLGELGDAAAEDLADRADKLSRGMDFKPLYDTRRRLFYIGLDIETGRPPDSYYDLLASEARQTSYLAIARGEVERRHWRRLGRALVTDDRYGGMASWTGTMFEYMMPHLLMPCYDNSLLYESARFCIYCHRKRGAAKGIPWGISESCFYAFDNALNYQYKAHGAPRLAFKRGLGKEMVISPYSSYLALLVQPQAAMKNLRRLRAMGLEGRYGLFEAADFTPSRRTGREEFETVRCFMSHHLGMSLMAIVNALRSNIMQKRFMRDAEMGAFAELLQEKVPVGAVSVRPFGREVPEKPRRAVAEGYRRSGPAGTGPAPICHILSNSSYTLFCTDAGLTSSHGSELSLTLFTPRGRAGADGMAFFLDDGQRALGLTPAPLFGKEAEYQYAFDPFHAEWRAKVEGLSWKLEARVPDNEMGEFRQVAVKNTSSKPKALTLACYFEPVLAKDRDYASHPAFSKLFLETAIEGPTCTIRRRPRGSHGEAWLAFTCDHPDVRYDTSREKALGRGGADTLSHAVRRPAQNTQSAVLDPCVLARVPLEINPGETVTVRFALNVAAKKEDAAAAAARTVTMPCQQEKPGRLEGVLRLLGLTNAETAAAFDILSGLVFQTGAPTGAARENTLGQSGLWKFGVSGDLPILLYDCTDENRIECLSRLIRQHRMLALCGAACDLVVLTRDGADYRRPMRTRVLETLKAIGADALMGARGGVHMVDMSLCSPEEKTLLLACADRLHEEPEAREAEDAIPPPCPRRAPERAEFRGGGDSVPPHRHLPDGAFQFDATESLPPCAWSHVLANPSFGALMTDAGTGYMWRLNARENKMTPWSNDPLALRGGEQITVEAAGREVSLFAAGDGCPTTVTYGFGYARWEKKWGGVKITATAFVPPDRMARVLTVRVEGNSRARLRYFSELTMGVDDGARRHIVFSQKNGGIVAENHFNTSFHPQTYAVTASEPARDAVFGLGEFSCTFPMIENESDQTLVLVTGCACNEPGLSLLWELAEEQEAARQLERTLAWWNHRICPLRADTPDETLNRYLNGWALYQTTASRLYARTSLYQCGGAFGFRDQLQDVCALVYGDPGAVKRQILRAAAHQFEEGDVQHWWHPGGRAPGQGDRGVRTRCSDDLLWLPYVVCEYLDKTDDESVLYHAVPYIVSPPLADGEDDRYESPRLSELRASIYDHCLRAADRVLSRGAGEHGLLLIGGGDWNDGFNLVGVQGRGESVWLTWFAAHTLDRLAAVCERMDDPGRADHYRRWAETLSSAAGQAWDGAWYLRGYYDDGDTLGSSKDMECRIDSIAQSFALLCQSRLGGEAERMRRTRVKTALRSARDKLVDRENRVVRLFTPAFESAPQNPGYIKGYVPGVRENGGQYTHAAVWLAMGLLLDGDADGGYEILNLLLPGTHNPAVYRAEPHLLAADVYDNAEHIGRGGWSAYTGAAAWYYRVAVEQLLGVRWQNGLLEVRPRMPSGWKAFTLSTPGGERLVVPAEGIGRADCSPGKTGQKNISLPGNNVVYSD